MGLSHHKNCNGDVVCTRNLEALVIYLYRNPLCRKFRPTRVFVESGSPNHRIKPLVIATKSSMCKLFHSYKSSLNLSDTIMMPNKRFYCSCYIRPISDPIEDGQKDRVQFPDMNDLGLQKGNSHNKDV
jgi:hypothetical protein